MGGVGIGMPFGADNGLSNPALISSVENYEVSFGGTLFMPDVESTGYVTTNTSQSEADTFIVPEVGFAMKATDNFYWGVGMWGASGLGVDYRNTNNAGSIDYSTSPPTITPNPNNEGMAQMVTNYQVLQLVVPLTYKTGGLSLSVAPVVYYGALDSDWNDPLVPFGSYGAGVSQDINFGANLGAAYQTGNLTLGAVYKSSIKMDYTGQPALDPAILGPFGVELEEGRLDVPSEYGIGASYVIGGKHTIAADYKVIAYGSTKGWEEFGWSDQDVIALGYQFDAGKWALRAGYNYAKAPIENLDWMQPGNAVRNYFNAVGFPATVESHVTVGGSYNFNKTLGMDLAFTYAPEVDTAYDVSLGGPAFQVETKHSQTALTAGLTFKF
jgi:long-chain fatty acid transport protein